VEEGRDGKAIETLEDTIKDYVKNLDDEEAHPFIENFYVMLYSAYLKVN